MRHMPFFISVCAISVLSILLIPGVHAETPHYTFQWVAYGNGNITYPYGIAVNSSGYVYIADTFNDSIQILSTEAEYRNFERFKKDGLVPVLASFRSR